MSGRQTTKGVRREGKMLNRGREVKIRKKSENGVKSKCDEEIEEGELRYTKDTKTERDIN